MPETLELLGKRFGKLVVKELAAQFHRCQQTIYNVWNGANNYYNRGD